MWIIDEIIEASNGLGFSPGDFFVVVWLFSLFLVSLLVEFWTFVLGYIYRWLRSRMKKKP